MLRKRIARVSIPIALLFWGITSCQKETDFAAGASLQPQDTIPSLPSTPAVSYTGYTIPAGAQYCEQEHFETIATQGIAFTVLFDSSAVYTTKDPANQADINKLYGFSDNRAHHHSFSARFGWRWYEHKLTLHGYIYNDSIREYKELGAVAIGKPVRCAILVQKDRYAFVLNNDTTRMRRTSKTDRAEGYRLYPYFGGDEYAPHTITIRIKEETGGG